LNDCFPGKLFGDSLYSGVLNNLIAYVLTQIMASNKVDDR